MEPPHDGLRIAAFGDSFTHGDEVSNQETWVHYLEVSLENAEILNLGVNGYGTDQALLRYRRDGARFQPRIVLIGLMLENLLRNVSVYRPAYYHKTSSISVKPRFRFDGEGSLDLAPMPVESASELRSAIRDGSLVPILMESDYWVRRAPLAYVRSRLFCLRSRGSLTGRTKEGIEIRSGTTRIEAASRIALLRKS